ncbi:MAG: hypothetical protein Q4D33_07030 [Prevotellaceae bacterium]|nr:hypothetical protein [Prevotellaceae bacterium]
MKKQYITPQTSICVSDIPFVMTSLVTGSDQKPGETITGDAKGFDLWETESDL